MLPLALYFSPTFVYVGASMHVCSCMEKNSIWNLELVFDLLLDNPNHPHLTFLPSEQVLQPTHFGPVKKNTQGDVQTQLPISTNKT